MRKVKIIGTLGPSLTEVFDRAKGLVDGVRINFSHGDHEEKRKQMKLVRKLDENLPIIMDTAGPELRIKKAVKISKGVNSLDLKLTADAKLSPGDVLMADDGQFRIEVTKNGLMSNKEGELRENSKITIVGKDSGMKTITERDREDIEFAVKEDVDAIALSFVKRPEDLVELSGILEELGALDVWMIPKIEHYTALDHLPEIIKMGDGVMVARGDLGVYMPPEKVPFIQKRIIKLARERCRPSIVATQMLSSMVNEPSPTRAEVSDIVNAVIDGADALLLSNETAIGKYPIESLEVLNKISKQSENASSGDAVPKNLAEDLAFAATRISDRSGASIFFNTCRGRTARKISKFRPSSPVFAESPSKRLMRNMRLIWGVNPGRPTQGMVIELNHLTDYPLIKAEYIGKIIARGDGYGCGKVNGIMGEDIKVVSPGENIPTAKALIYRGKPDDGTFQKIILSEMPMIVTKDPVPNGKRVEVDLDLGVVMEA
jgi:pyruvate kinase